MADIKIKRRILSACQTNCYYVFRDGSDEMVIIDPGDRGDIVYQDVKSLGCKKDSRHIADSWSWRSYGWRITTERIDGGKNLCL